MAKRYLPNGRVAPAKKAPKKTRFTVTKTTTTKKRKK
jgi:hypothetical protein